ncbi:Asp23/Gls24 family envelope stress response protein [Streptomyces lushanensis]|uniref:Asp23/Gls24 family envelope stress response protein n=1 Tax=Streptomyces lushanensis TaxID=1434255 RepID=UPI0008366421|nr:Asp23/Gls24 family envelope stress response protein [Streptomyces lushanensis]
MAANEATLAGSKESTVKGKTTIADSVVASIAGIAAREANGVHAMGGGVSRTLGAVRGKMPGADDSARGVQVEVGEKQTAIDLGIVVEYGTPITETAGNIRSNVSEAVESMTGLDVVEVNIGVLDVFVPGAEDEETGESPRVE